MCASAGMKLLPLYQEASEEELDYGEEEEKEVQIELNLEAILDTEGNDISELMILFFKIDQVVISHAIECYIPTSIHTMPFDLKYLTSSIIIYLCHYLSSYVVWKISQRQTI